MTRNTPQNSNSMGLMGTAWLGFAVLLALAPLVFNSAMAVSLLTQMGIAMVFGLSYNMLLGQAGMLSFGHAAYAGLGAFTAVHAMNLAGGGLIWLPLPLVPVAGGLAGLLFGALIGYVTTRRSGTTFAMITLGLGQMVYACALMFPAFFGGEGGVSTDRVYGGKFFGLNFGSQLQVYYLIAAWLFISAVAIYALTRTPLGRITNAVRDNDERVAFIGYEPRWVRYLALVLSGGFAGIAGALSAINFEVATAENLSLLRSGDVLLFTFIGGVGFFVGPMVGAVVGVVMTIMLSDYTQAWHMYLGLLFVLVVVYAPEGLCSLAVPALRLLRRALHPKVGLRLVALVCVAALLLAGTVTLIELAYHRAAGMADALTLLGVALDAGQPLPWLASGAAAVLGWLGIKPCGRWMLAALEAAEMAGTQQAKTLERSAA